MSYITLPDGTIEVLHERKEIPGTNEIIVGAEFPILKKAEEGRKILAGYNDYYSR